MNRSAAGVSEPFQLSARVFAVFLLIYLSTWAGHYTTGDGSFKIAWAKAMLGQDPGTPRDQYGAYSKYGIGHSLLAVPPLAAGLFVINQRLRNQRRIRARIAPPEVDHRRGVNS